MQEEEGPMDISEMMERGHKAGRYAHRQDPEVLLAPLLSGTVW